MKSLKSYIREELYTTPINTTGMGNPSDTSGDALSCCCNKKKRKKISESLDDKTLKELKEMLAQCVTYPGGLSISKYDKCQQLVKSLSDIDCEENEMTQEDIYNKMKTSEYVHIHVYAYDKKNVGFVFTTKKSSIQLTDGYCTIKNNQPEYKLENLNTRLSYLMDIDKFVDIMNDVSWPEDKKFTNTTSFDDFYDDLQKALNDIYK